MVRFMPKTANSSVVWNKYFTFGCIHMHTRRDPFRAPPTSRSREQMRTQAVGCELRTLNYELPPSDPNHTSSP